jgi:hypothetical protein
MKKKKLLVLIDSIHNLCQIQLNPNFRDRVSKNIQILNLTKICPLEAEFLHTDRRTDRAADTTELVVDFSSFANRPKNLFRSAEI